MKYIAFKCYLRLTLFSFLVLCMIPSFFCLATRAKQAKNNSTLFSNDYGPSQVRVAKLRKAAYVFCRFQWEWASIERMRVCNDTTNAYIHITHTLQCNLWCWLLRKHCLPIIGVKYITWNYFMDAKQNEKKKKIETELGCPI